MIRKEFGEKASGAPRFTEPPNPRMTGPGARARLRKKNLDQAPREDSFARAIIGTRFQGPAYKACTAAITASAWPFTFTLGNTAATFPAASMTKVVRSMPMNFRPYKDFSFHTP